MLLFTGKDILCKITTIYDLPRYLLSSFWKETGKNYIHPGFKVVHEENMVSEERVLCLGSSWGTSEHVNEPISSPPFLIPQHKWVQVNHTEDNDVQYYFPNNFTLSQHTMKVCFLTGQGLKGYPERTSCSWACGMGWLCRSADFQVKSTDRTGVQYFISATEVSS